MSTRGFNFLDQWLANNIPESVTADVISVDELTNRLLNDASAVGIKRIEIDEESTASTARSLMPSCI